MVKIILIALIFALIIIFLRNIKSDLAILVEIMSGITLIILSLDYLTVTFEFFNRLISLSGIDKETFRIILKITAIAYLVEFGAGTIEDFGLKGLSSKLVFIGKFVILGLSFPIIYSVFNMFYGILS